ncbi:glycoside hydrolase family 3 N-terminal domain-containing protein [Pontiellaceae bacterium B12219]|nr:glycoside hydrolase family 3 N-terminal domain-containing protein [Pontiellaceae bacterium B12219]
MEKSSFIQKRMGEMNLSQKVGQMMVFGFCGPIITPDIKELITKYHVGGLRISQKFRALSLAHDVKPGTVPDESIMRSIMQPEGIARDYSSFSAATSANAYDYAKVLNQLRTLSQERDLGIPIHFTADQEGSACDDILGGHRLFPHPKGIGMTGEPELAYQVALQTGRQLRALGVNMIHSPVLDVNTNPLNPEIGTRSYSAYTEEVITYAREAIRGYLDAGLVCTGKHFPGRGESVTDAHWDLPVVDLGIDKLTDEHIRPYREMFKAGLPAVMTAHSRYPALGVNDIPGSTSKRIITELLREELGFEGLITTDNMMMGGILRMYPMVEAVIRVIEAGHDLVLCRDESPMRLKILEGVEAAVKSGRIAESRIDESVARILSMRYDQSLFEDSCQANPAEAQAIIDDPDVVSVTIEAAQKSTVVLRDRENLLPLPTDQKIMLIEQIFPTQQFSNNMYSHPGLLWESMSKHSDNVACIEINNAPTEHDMERIERRIDESDLIVMTNYYYHKAASSISEQVRELIKRGKRVVVVANSPFEFASPEDFGSVILCYQPGGPEHMDAVADLLFGKKETK